MKVGGDAHAGHRSNRCNRHRSSKSARPTLKFRVSRTRSSQRRKKNQFHIRGNGHPTHHLRPQINRWRGDELRRQIDDLQVIIEKRRCTAMQRSTGQTNARAAVAPATGAAKVPPFRRSQENVGTAVSGLPMTFQRSAGLGQLLKLAAWSDDHQDVRIFRQRFRPCQRADQGNTVYTRNRAGSTREPEHTRQEEGAQRRLHVGKHMAHVALAKVGGNRPDAGCFG